VLCFLVSELTAGKCGNASAVPFELAQRGARRWIFAQLGIPPGGSRKPKKSKEKSRYERFVKHLLTVK
jgi:hypothetical protein